MNPNDPNIQRVEEIATALGSLLEQVVLVGGAAVGFLVTDPGQPRIRATLDVDMVVEVATRSDYYELEQELRSYGFKQDMREDAPICRWVHGTALLDLMPTDEALLGFSNPWYRHAIASAETQTLTSGDEVRVISGPVFVATKLVAFSERGNADYMSSHDMEDIIAVVDGRDELVSEIESAQQEVKAFVSGSVASLVAEQRFLEALPGHLPPDAASQGRLPDLVQKLREIAALSS